MLEYVLFFRDILSDTAELALDGDSGRVVWGRFGGVPRCAALWRGVVVVILKFINTA